MTAGDDSATVFGSECTHLASEGPYAYCGAPATWLHIDRSGTQPLNVLCDAHRTRASVPIPHDAPRTAPSEYLLKR